MSESNFIIDTRQLERLGDNLAIFPRELSAAIAASLKAATVDSLKTVIPQHYAIRPNKLANTHRVRRQLYGSYDEEGVQFEIYGRRLTPARFTIKPLRNLAMQPSIEIFTGGLKKARKKIGADGKEKTPFVMFTKTKKGSTFNVFIGTGRRQQKRKHREALYSYRTISVPQMLFSRRVGDDVQTHMLSIFDEKLMHQIERRTQLVQENITRG